MKRNEFINEYVTLNRKFEVAFLPLVKKAIHFKVKKVIRELRDGGFDRARNHLHTDLTNTAMTEIVSKLYNVVGLKHAQLNYSRQLHELRRRKYVTLQLETKGFGFNKIWAEFIKNYLNRNLLSKITIEINNTTRDALLRALSAMIVEGLGVDGAVERLDNWPYEEFQAARIVRTEVNRAANTGVKAQTETSPWQQTKEWCAVHDNRTRGNPITGNKDHANHWALDKITIDEHDSFHDTRNGDLLDFPGDPKGSAASTINCRCSLLTHFKRDQDGNLIPKRKTTTVIYPGQIRRPQTITI
jgi:hypothetical protein